MVIVPVDKFIAEQSHDMATIPKTNYYCVILAI